MGHFAVEEAGMASRFVVFCAMGFLKNVLTGVTSISSCAAGLVFNSRRGQCDYPKNTPSCGHGTGTTTIGAVSTPVVEEQSTLPSEASDQLHGKSDCCMGGLEENLIAHEEAKREEVPCVWWSTHEGEEESTFFG